MKSFIKSDNFPPSHVPTRSRHSVVNKITYKDKDYYVIVSLMFNTNNLT